MHSGVDEVDPYKLEQCVFAINPVPKEQHSVGSLQLTVYGSVAYQHLTASHVFYYDH